MAFNLLNKAHEAYACQNVVGLSLVSAMSCSPTLKITGAPSKDNNPDINDATKLKTDTKTDTEEQKNKREADEKKKAEDEKKKKMETKIILEDGMEYEFVGAIPELVIEEVDYFVNVFKIKQDQFKIKIVSFQENKNDYKTPKTLRDELDAKIVVNGGFFGEGKAPNIADGLLIIEGKKISDVNPKLSGVLAIQENHVSIIETDQFKIEEMKPDTFAIQGNPRLIDRGGKIGIQKPDLKTTKDKRTTRTAICTNADGEILLLVTDRKKSGLYLYEMAQVAKFKGCDIALNLDGGPATGISVKDYTQEMYKDVEIPAKAGWVHPNLIVIE